MNIIIAYGDGSFRQAFNVDSNPDPKDVLETAFANFNHGSGKEMTYFLMAKVRSMSVGDFVKVDSQWFQCESIGWAEVSEEFVSDWLDRVKVRARELERSGEVDGRMSGWCAMSDLMHAKRMGKTVTV